MDNQRWKILLVEDDEDDYILTRDLLAEATPEPVELAWSPDIEAGLDLMRSSGFDAILVDYELGALDGMSFIKKAMEAGCSAPIIMLTGHGNRQIDLQAIQFGAFDYLSKSEITPQMLERSVRHAIDRKRIEAELLQAREQLEEKVRERTRQLNERNDALVAEIVERKRLETQLRRLVERIQLELEQRKKMEAELGEMHSRLIESVEAERLALSRDLHDGPMQDLYGVTYQLKAIQEDLQDTGAGSRLGELGHALQEVVRTLRARAGELRPPTLAPYGLEKTLKSNLETFQQQHPEIEVACELEPDLQRLPERCRLALFRIYQTCLSNILRHAGARHVTVHFSLSESSAYLSIEDDGRGFVVPERWLDLVRSGHYGLAGASERAEAVGGRLQVSSQPGAGTRVFVSIPLPPPGSDEPGG